MDGISESRDGLLSLLIALQPEFFSWTEFLASSIGAMSQPPTVTTAAIPTPATAACPTSADCFNYSLQVPASNPQAGTFASGSITYAAPATGAVTYAVSGITANCTACTSSPATASPITVTPGTATSVSTVLALSGCTTP